MAIDASEMIEKANVKMLLKSPLTVKERNPLKKLVFFKKDTVFEIIGLETLNNFFNGKFKGELLIFKNVRCVQCGELVDIEIQKTSGGFGFLNGVISEPVSGQILAKCHNCYGIKEGK